MAEDRAIRTAAMYTLWLKIESDDGRAGDDDEGWLALAGDLTRPDAVSLGNEISTLVERSKIAEPSDPLDGWWGAEFGERNRKG